MKLLDYQEERIKLIKYLLPNFGKRYILKGGTALILYYGIERYSEDIDLDVINGGMNLIESLRNPGYKTWELGVKKDADTVFRVMIDYGAYNDKGKYPLKIEVSSRNKEDIRQNILKYKTINGVNVYNLETLKEQKIIALLRRNKIRDFFDVGMLLQKYPEIFSNSRLRDLKTEMDYSGLDNLSDLLKIEIREHKLKEMDAEKFVLDIYELIEDKLYGKSTNLFWG